MKQHEKISSAVIRRLPRYLRALEDLQNSGTERISSGELSKLIGYTASQIRQDLNHFGGFGQQGHGYNVKDLKAEIEKILGLGRQYKMVIVGSGRLGQAINSFIHSYSDDFCVTSLFDVKEDLIGKEKSDEPHHVVARKVSLNKRLRPLYKAAACVAIVLSIGQAAQMPYYKSEAEQQESLARSLEQLQQIQKDKNAVAQGDSLIKIEKLKIEN